MKQQKRAALVRDQYDCADTAEADAVAKAMVAGANAALASSEAAALRFNNTLSTINTTIRGAATTGVDTFVAGLVKGEGAMQALKDAATDVGKALTNAGLNSLVTTGLNAIGGAGQTAGATASATILTTAGTSLAASMVAGATSAAGILAGGGTAAGDAMVGATSVGGSQLATAGQVAGVGIDAGTSVGGAELVTGGASAGGFIASAAAILDVSTASLAAVLGPLAAVAAVPVGVGMVFGANKSNSEKETNVSNNHTSPTRIGPYYLRRRWL
jgi:hypothetical protein